MELAASPPEAGPTLSPRASALEASTLEASTLEACVLHVAAHQGRPLTLGALQADLSATGQAMGLAQDLRRMMAVAAAICLFPIRSVSCAN